jgi:hypothetical protein
VALVRAGARSTQRESLPVWLLSIYFCGVHYDGAVEKPVGPASEAEWRPHINALHAEMGLPEPPHLLSDRGIELFLPSIVKPVDARR